MDTDKSAKGAQSNDAQGSDDGPTEVAEVLHGDQARVETNPQPTDNEIVKLDGDTRIAKPADVDE